jgi:hypothetical protein
MSNDVLWASALIQGDLERFEAYIETRGQETGAWRGTIR